MYKIKFKIKTFSPIAGKDTIISGETIIKAKTINEALERLINKINKEPMTRRNPKTNKMYELLYVSIEMEGDHG